TFAAWPLCAPGSENRWRPRRSATASASPAISCTCFVVSGATGSDTNPRERAKPRADYRRRFALSDFVFGQVLTPNALRVVRLCFLSGLDSRVLLAVTCLPCHDDSASNLRAPSTM